MITYDYHLDCTKYIKSLNDTQIESMNQRLSSLSQTIETLKDEKVRQDQAIGQKEERIGELLVKNVCRQSNIFKLSETNDQMKQDQKDL